MQGRADCVISSSLYSLQHAKLLSGYNNPNSQLEIWDSHAVPSFISGPELVHNDGYSLFDGHTFHTEECDACAVELLKSLSK